MSLASVAEEKLAQKKEAERRAALVVREAPPFQEWVDDEGTVEDPHRAGRSDAVLPFRMWEAQRDYAARLFTYAQTIILKARQLGVSWVLAHLSLWYAIWFAGATILVFSKDEKAALEFIRRTKGIWERLKTKPTRRKGRDAVQEINFTNGSRIIAFASTKNAGTSFTATVLIVDEADKIQYGDDLYTSIKPTIQDGGQIHIVFTAFGWDGLGRKLWHKAGSGYGLDGQVGLSQLHRIFIPYHARPGRNRDWYNQALAEAISLAHHKQEYPNTPEDALGFTNVDARFLEQMEMHDRLVLPFDDPVLQRLHSLPRVVALDAGVKDDYFGRACASWHPVLKVPFIHSTKVWRPQDEAGGEVNLTEVFADTRALLRSSKVAAVTFDPSQLLSFGQELKRNYTVTEFGQNTERIAGDTRLYFCFKQADLALAPAQADLRAALDNADHALAGSERKIRLIKRGKQGKIDLAVAAAMAVHRLTDDFQHLKGADLPQGISPLAALKRYGSPFGSSRINERRFFQGLPPEFKTGDKSNRGEG